jgi:MFS family permease
VRRPLLPAALTFAVFGAFAGSWAVSAADWERELHISHGQFGTLVSVALAVAGIGNALGGVQADRRGLAKVMTGALCVWGVLLLASTAARPRVVLALAFVVVVGSSGLVDVLMNVAATAELAFRPGHLVRFHALFNAGAAVGAGITAVALANGGSWRWSWGVIGVTTFALAAVWSRHPDPERREHAEHPSVRRAFRDVRAQHLTLVALAFAVAAMVEGSVELWGVVYLRSRVSSGLAVGATSAVLAYSIAAAARITFGPLSTRKGPARGVVIGATLASLGTFVLAGAPGSIVPGAGLVLAAGGISMCWPLLLAIVGRSSPDAGSAVGAVSAVGYTGLVFGPAVVGWLAQATNLRAGLVVIAVGAAFVATAATRRVARGTTPPSGPTPPATAPAAPTPGAPGPG